VHAGESSIEYWRHFNLFLAPGGSWPLSELWCIFYQTCDVLACSVSILHLMFISIGRYRGISKPLAQRQVISGYSFSCLYPLANTVGYLNPSSETGNIQISILMFISISRLIEWHVQFPMVHKNICLIFDDGEIPVFLAKPCGQTTSRNLICCDSDIPVYN